LLLAGADSAPVPFGGAWLLLAAAPFSAACSATAWSADCFPDERLE